MTKGYYRENSEQEKTSYNVINSAKIRATKCSNSIWIILALTLHILLQHEIMYRSAIGSSLHTTKGLNTDTFEVDNTGPNNWNNCYHNQSDHTEGTPDNILVKNVNSL
jgi:hypothetical protein